MYSYSIILKRGKNVYKVLNTVFFLRTTHSIVGNGPYYTLGVYYFKENYATYSVWWGITSSWKNFLTLSRKMSCSEEKILLIPMSVNCLAEELSWRSSPPEWEHLKNIYALGKLSEFVTLHMQINVTEQHVLRHTVEAGRVWNLKNLFKFEHHHFW